MTANDYVLWFIATTVAVSALLAFGTLAAADLLHRPHRHTETDAAPTHEDQGEHHHWYDRFHFHHAA